MYSDKRSGNHQIRKKPIQFEHGGKTYASNTADDAIMIAAGIFAVTGIEDVDTKIYEPGAPAFAENGINVSVGYPNKSLKPDADLHALRLAELAHERWGHETGGAVVNGVTIPTDRSDRTLIKQALDEIADPPATMPFKVAWW